MCFIGLFNVKYCARLRLSTCWIYQYTVSLRYFILVHAPNGVPSTSMYVMHVKLMTITSDG